jgi:DNA replication and repair protein RecF
VLDGIHYLSLTKSALQASDALSIQHDAEFFTVKGKFIVAANPLEVRCTLEQGKKKQIFQNGKAVDKVSDHVGKIPLVLIAPDDTELIKGGSEGRRKFFDGLLAQLDHPYLDQLIRYHHFLKQRNALLKQFADTGRRDLTLLAAYEEELIPLSQSLAKRRATLIQEISPLLQRYYEALSMGREQVGLSYETEALREDFSEYYIGMRPKDFATKNCNAGIHKDDFDFRIDSHPLRKLGSQGQQKSFIIALKLAQFELFEKAKGEKPLLLLDDIFDKLDDLRTKKLMKKVSDHDFGQIFITDTSAERIQAIFDEIGEQVRIFNVENGQVSQKDA